MCLAEAVKLCHCVQNRLLWRDKTCFAHPSSSRAGKHKHYFYQFSFFIIINHHHQSSSSNNIYRIHHHHQTKYIYVYPLLLIFAGLYGERVGALSFVLSDAGAAKRVLSQLKRIARAIYSNPPVHGARIVAEVVGNEDMFTEWKEEMEGMAGRIKVSMHSMASATLSC
jgi:hypothetical protein